MPTPHAYASLALDRPLPTLSTPPGAQARKPSDCKTIVHIVHMTHSRPAM